MTTVEFTEWPKGICIFHSQSRIVQKVTLDHNDKGKWEADA